MSEQKCPKCGSKMLTRKGKYNDFLGCSRFPKCKGTRNLSKGNNQAVRELKSIDKPNHRQDKIFQAVESIVKNKAWNNKKHLMVNAGPGTGKTTTEEHITLLLKKLDLEASVVYLVFNKHVEREAVSKGLPARTTHSFYYEQYRNWYQQKVEVKDDKVNLIVKNLIQTTWDADKFLISPVCQLVSKVKNTCVPTDNENLDKLCERFNIEVNGSQERVFELTKLVIEENNKQLNVIDLDDMLYLVWKLKIPIQPYKYVLVDEAQDFNRVQIENLKRTVSEDGMVVIVGDENQSMYGFRGAALDAMEQMKNYFDAASLPLDITYRCPKSHVDLLNQIFPDRPLFAHSEAKEGKLLSMSVDKMIGQLKDGDLVLCRTNAPLVEPVFSLIRQGVKAVIRGRDIGANLINLVEKFEEKNPQIDNFLIALYEYGQKEIGKLLKQEKNSQAQSLQDKIDTISAISEGCTQTYQIKLKINEVFSDQKEGVVFSTVHKAKGDEANNVYILQPQLMPHPMAEADWEIEQEKNILWVALSRSKDTMVFVGGPAPTPIWDEEVKEEISSEDISQIVQALDLPEETQIFKDVEFGITDEGEVELITEEHLELSPEEEQLLAEQDFESNQPIIKAIIKEEWRAPEIPVCPF